LTSTGIILALIGLSIIGVIVWGIREIDKIDIDLDGDDE